MPRSPLPAIVTRPSTKSVGAAGIGSGSQRSWLGGVGTSSKRLTMPRRRRSRSNGSCIAAGRMRYSHERRLSARGAVNAVPRQLLGVQAVRRALRRVAPDRQRARKRFGGELVAEADEVLRIGGGHVGVSRHQACAAGATSSAAASTSFSAASASPMRVDRQQGEARQEQRALASPSGSWSCRDACRRLVELGVGQSWVIWRSPAGAHGRSACSIAGATSAASVCCQRPSTWPSGRTR